MSSWRLYLSIGWPMLIVILAWLSNRADMKRLSDKLDRNMETLRAELGTLRAGLNAMRADHHKDLVSLMGYMGAPTRTHG